LLRFAGFELRLRERRLLSRGEPLSLGARAFDVLVALVQRHGELVTKSELMDAVWPGLVVEENNLQVHISTLRKLLGPSAIATIPGLGYRFTLPLDDAPALAQPASTGQPTADYSRAARSMAVLPFANVSGDPEQEYFSDGLAEDIITKLSRSRWLYVIARNSSFERRQAGSAAQICRDLDCHYVVMGSVRRAGRSLRVTAELIDGPRNQSLWSQRFDAPLEDLFRVQDDITSSIVSTIEPVYLRQQERVAQRDTGLADAASLRYWESLMQARWHFWRTSRTHIEKSQALVQQALAERPEDPPALCLQAFTYMAKVWGGWSVNPKADVLEANRLALRAVRNDDSDANAHFTLGTALSFTANIGQAIAEQQHALSLYPEFAAAAGELGRLLAFSGRTDEAAEYILQAIDASPHDPHLSLWVRSRAIACFADGDYVNALRYAQEAVAKRGNWFFNHYLLAVCLAATGRLPEAQAALLQAKPYGASNLQTLRFGHPFVREADFERFVGFLRAAGWQPQEPAAAPSAQS
jgi:TolB-like protein/tetratricopeptide (TPR) repeat protein